MGVQGGCGYLSMFSVIKSIENYGCERIKKENIECRTNKLLAHWV